MLAKITLKSAICILLLGTLSIPIYSIVATSDEKSVPQKDKDNLNLPYEPIEMQDKSVKQILQQLTARKDAIKDIEVSYELISIAATSKYEKHGGMMSYRTTGETFFSNNLWRRAGIMEYLEEKRMFELKRHSFESGEYQERLYSPVLDADEGSEPIRLEKLGFDGEKTVRFTESRRESIKQPPFVRIFEGKTEDFDEFIGYKDFLFVPKDEWNIVDGSVSREEFLGRPCIRFSVKEFPSSDMVYQYWCDLSHAGTPIRVDKLIRGTIWRGYEISELRQFEEGLWLPVNSIIRTFIEGKPIGVYLLRVNELNINRGLNSEDFQVAYSKEVRIEDLTKNVRLETVLKRLAELGNIVLVSDLHVYRLLQDVTPAHIREIQTSAEMIDFLKKHQIKVQPSLHNERIWYVYEESREALIETKEFAGIKKLRANLPQEDSNIKHCIELRNIDIGYYCETISKLTHKQIVADDRLHYKINVIRGPGLSAQEVIDVFEATLRLFGLDIQQTNAGEYKVQKYTVKPPVVVK